jgi:hypothetical protein
MNWFTDEVFTPGLTEEQKDFLRLFSKTAVDAAKELGVDVSEIGIEFIKAEDGSLTPIITVDED